MAIDQSFQFILSRNMNHSIEELRSMAAAKFINPPFIALSLKYLGLTKEDLDCYIVDEISDDYLATLIRDIYGALPHVDYWCANVGAPTVDVQIPSSRKLDQICSSTIGNLKKEAKGATSVLSEYHNVLYFFVDAPITHAREVELEGLRLAINIYLLGLSGLGEYNESDVEGGRFLRINEYQLQDEDSDEEEEEETEEETEEEEEEYEYYYGEDDEESSETSSVGSN